MIACPQCGGETRCGETRRTQQGARRRRYCSDPKCTGKVTTLEVVVATEGGLDAPITGDWAFVRVDEMARALEMFGVALDGARRPERSASETQRTARLSRIEPKVCEPAFLADLLPDPRSDSGE